MSGDGSFSDAARAAIYESCGQRCAGCGRPDLSAQHRIARGRGGTSGVAAARISSPANGIPLCGDGVRGSHGWAEANPEWAELLGWRLPSTADPEGAPFWTRFGWRAWLIEPDGFPSVEYVDEDDLDRLPDRLRAVAVYKADVAKRDEALRKRLDRR